MVLNFMEFELRSLMTRLISLRSNDTTGLDGGDLSFVRQDTHCSVRLSLPGYLSQARIGISNALFKWKTLWDLSGLDPPMRRSTLR